ncbi:hypothetical protein ACS0TY_018252 [Phlomoides rotata]
MARNGIRAHYDIEEAIEHLYDVTVFGQTILTTVTKYPQAITQWINDVQPDGVFYRYIGFDIKMVAGADNVIATVQFCEGRRCLVIQLLRMCDYPASLAQFLLDTNITFVGVDLVPKLDLLTELLCIEEGPVAYTDLGIPAAHRYQRPELSTAAQSALVTTALGMRLEMPPRVEADWNRHGKLSDAQVQYACIQAFVSFELGRWLLRDGDN